MFRSAPKDGAHIHGLYLEGASWDVKQSVLVDSKLKELHPQMPVLLIKVTHKITNSINSN